MLIRSLLMLCALLALAGTRAEAKLKALILDGHNNHNWRATTPVLKQALEDSGKFTVDVATAEKNVSNYSPKFSDYDVVVSNYNGPMWPEATQKALLDYVGNGGGFVVVHAANNSFGKWKEYNEMIGLGGWGGRNENSGPYVYYDGEKLVRDDAKGRGGTHGPQHEFLIVMRDSHPITEGLPSAWMHAKDELYALMRGPAVNMKVLGSAESRKTKRHEPLLMVIDYGKGRVFHTALGHADYSMKGVGFQTTLQRGAEWAATGKVTIDVPENFPTAEKGSSVK
ncbi:MAG: ThuA domain-containing protein [Pirellulales bacterium]|nr:ThuA domain-containing protein [Pirellulales bacterium]